MDALSRQCFELKQEELQAIPEDQLVPISIPIPHIQQEAETLYQTCQEDLEVLLNKTAVTAELIDDLNVRAGALRFTQGKWAQGKRNLEECLKEWTEASPEAYDFRDELAHTFFYAYRNLPDVLEALRNIISGSSNDDMIQDLTDLAIMGKDNPAPLEAINFDMTLLDKAEQMSDDMADLLAKVNGARESNNPIKLMRDKAYFYLKQAMDEIKKAGQYIFWRNETRRSLYASKYLRRKITMQRDLEKQNTDDMTKEAESDGSQVQE